MATKSYVNSLEITLDSEIAALEASKRAAARAGVSASPPPFAPAMPAMPAMPAPAAPAPPVAAQQMTGQRLLHLRGGPVLAASAAIVAVVGLLVVLSILLSPQITQRFSGGSPLPLATGTAPVATAAPGTSAPSATPAPPSVPGPIYRAPGIIPAYIAAGALLVLLMLVLLVRRGMSARATTGRAPAPLPPPPSDLEALDLRIARLGQIREWLQQDARLRDMVDDAIRHQVLASERRQKTLSVVLSVASLGVGWLLSPINPLAVMAGFLHR
jgi:hypothetical protein